MLGLGSAVLRSVGLSQNLGQHVLDGVCVVILRFRKVFGEDHLLECFIVFAEEPRGGIVRRIVVFVLTLVPGTRSAHPGGEELDKQLVTKVFTDAQPSEFSRTPVTAKVEALAKLCEPVSDDVAKFFVGRECCRQ